MKQSRSIGKEPSLSRIVLVSAILHLLFISLVVIPLKTKEKEFRTYYVTLVGPIRSPRVGRVPLPKKKVSRTTKQKAVKIPPKADISLKEIERVAKEIERIRVISALKKRKKAREKTQEIQIGREKTPDKLVQGTGIPGSESGGDIHFYYSIIGQKIWQQWVVPDFKTSGLEMAKISIRISKDGKVISREIEKSSGNALFDRSAMKAISKASPLPPPPFGEMEVGLNFHP